MRLRTSRKGNLLEALGYLLLCGVLLSGSASLRVQAGLAEKVVRLHVLANSDAPADQADKEAVRDAVLERAEELLSGVRDRDEAADRLRAALPDLSRTAARVLSRRGHPEDVRAELRETEFPTRHYDGFSLPAGRYLALRILIGDAAGKNWWCVVFPPLCMAAGESVPDTDGGFSADELRLITDTDTGYVMKFRTVELWEKLRQALESPSTCAVK